MLTGLNTLQMAIIGVEVEFALFVTGFEREEGGLAGMEVRHDWAAQTIAACLKARAVFFPEGMKGGVESGDEREVITADVSQLICTIWSRD